MDSSAKSSGNTIVSLKQPWRAIDTSDSYYEHIWNTVCLIAASTNCTYKSGRGQNLYHALIHNGFKKKCHHETQVPHLVKVIVRKKEEIDCDPTKLMFKPTLNKKTGLAESAMIEISPRCGISSGLYLCSLSLNLSNPHWKIELTLPDTIAKDPSIIYKQGWIFDNILENIPDKHPKTCEAQITLTLMQHMGPLPPPPPHPHRCPTHPHPRRWMITFVRAASRAANFNPATRFVLFLVWSLNCVNIWSSSAVHAVPLGRESKMNTPLFAISSRKVILCASRDSRPGPASVLIIRGPFSSLCVTGSRKGSGAILPS